MRGGVRKRRTGRSQEEKRKEKRKTGQEGRK